MHQQCKNGRLGLGAVDEREPFLRTEGEGSETGSGKRQPRRLRLSPAHPALSLGQDEDFALAHERHQFIVHDLDDLLPRRDA